MIRKEKNRSIGKIIAFPPFYFFAGIVLSLLFYFIFPEYNLLTFPFNLFGFLILVTGLLLIIKNTVVFNSKKTTLQNEQPSSFIQDGFYKYSRNPMYLGGLIFHIGLSILTGNIISIINPILFFLMMDFICIPYEEEIMIKTFKDEYRSYKKKVRRWL